MADYANIVQSYTLLPVAQDDYANTLLREGSGSSSLSYRNKVFDPGGPDWVLWSTSSPDTTGSSYPDPYGTGFVGCSGFRVTAQHS